MCNHRGMYRAQVFEGGKTHHLGTFATAEEAALCYARHVGAELGAWAAEARVAVQQPLTADEARAAAAAEGLELVLSSSSATGFKWVSKRGGRYEAHCNKDGKKRFLGTYATAEEAALCYARHIGAERAAAEAARARVGAATEAARARVGGPQPLTVWANSFEWLPARPHALAPAPAHSSTLTPTPTLAPASAAVGKDLSLNHFVRNDAGRSVLV